MSTNTWNRYGPQPTSGQEDPFASARFAPAVLESVQTPRLGSYLVDKSIGWDAINVPLVTALPVRPKDQTIVRFVADEDTGAIWTLMYWAGAPSAYRWHFIGGSPLINVSTDTTTRAVSTYGDPASGAETTFTLNLAGDYRIEVGANMQPGSAGFGIFASFSVAGATALDTDAAEGYYGATTDPGESSNHNVAYKTGLAAGTTIQQKFKAQGASAGTLKQRYIIITPIRVSS